MEATEVRKLAQLEDGHWWYRERRHLLAKAIAGLTPGRALDVGAAGGGNTRVLRDHGWQAVALEYGADGAEVAAGRGLATLRSDATALPIADDSLDDDAAVAEVHRVLRPTGTYLIAVPADPRLWSEHDEAVDHVRRYTRPGLVDLLERGRFQVESVQSWNVLLRPVVAMRRKTSSGSDLDDLHPIVNFGLRTIITAERYLPVKDLPGVSLLLRARPIS
jgi:SAM-dependent methyltransferase